MNTLRYLANELRIPLICAGTADARIALTTDPQLADRFEAFELPVWQNDEAFLRLPASFQSVFPLRQRSDLTGAASRRSLLDRTEGATVRIVRLLETLAVDAIRSGKERIDKDSLEDTRLSEYDEEGPGSGFAKDLPSPGPEVLGDAMNVAGRGWTCEGSTKSQTAGQGLLTMLRCRPIRRGPRTLLGTARPHLPGWSIGR